MVHPADKTNIQGTSFMGGLTKEWFILLIKQIFKVLYYGSINKGMVHPVHKTNIQGTLFMLHQLIHFNINKYLNSFTLKKLLA